MNFNYYLAVNLMFGRGKAELIGTEAAKYGKKALIVTGHSSTKKSGLLDRAVKLLADAGLESAIYDKVSQNPLTRRQLRVLILPNPRDAMLSSHLAAAASWIVPRR